MSEFIHFTVEGKPVPKQSFRVTKRGGGYTAQDVTGWQKAVGYAAKQAMNGRDPLSCPVAVELIFYLHDKIHRDVDNLSKGVLDGMKDIVFDDDNQVMDLHIHKRYSRERPGVRVMVQEAAASTQQEMGLA